jgi:hypothetical protein
MHDSFYETVPYTDLPPLPPDTPFFTEWEALRRAMPRLLAEGHDGHYALIRGDEVIGAYET